MTLQIIGGLCIYYELLLLISVYGASIPREASFSVSSILDPVLHPIVAAGSNRCIHMVVGADSAPGSVHGAHTGRGVSLCRADLNYTRCLIYLKPSVPSTSPVRWVAENVPTVYQQWYGEALKSFFGITYEQMLERNRTNFNEVLSIDHITKNGNIKHNLSEIIFFKKLMDNAESVYFLVHGFMESSDGLMVQGVAPELLKQRRAKVFALDGRKLIRLEYFSSSTYVRFMGQKFGSFLTDLIRRGVNASKITLVGHSLGAHIAGIAGEQVRERTGNNVARITGLDPAGPCFSNIDAAARLDATDAEYVDVIHTNGGMLGMREPVGHKDFYPNNGMSQPGCFFSTCDHSRAWELYAESINSPDHFPARKCENWTMFQDGFCAKNIVTYMGLNSRPGNSGKYFLTTGSSTPFSLGGAGSG